MSFTRAACCCGGVVYRLSRCNTSDVIYTTTNLSAYVGQVVKVAGICYGVTIETGTPTQAVTVQSNHATCAACGDVETVCSSCVPGTTPETGEFELTVSGVTVCPCIGVQDMTPSTINGTFSLDRSSACLLAHETATYDIQVKTYASPGCTGALLYTCQYKLLWEVQFNFTTAPYALRIEGFAYTAHPGNDGDCPGTGALGYSFFFACAHFDDVYDCGINRVLSNQLIAADCGVNPNALSPCSTFASAVIVGGYGGSASLSRA